MRQECITIDGMEIKQPEIFNPEWATTYTDGSGRSMSGVGHLDPMFTAESYSVEFFDLTPEEAKIILQMIVPRPSKPTFKLHYYSWFYGMWRTDTFYVGKGSLKCRTLEYGQERLDGISCSMIGVNPL